MPLNVIKSDQLGTYDFHQWSAVTMGLSQSFPWDILGFLHQRTQTSLTPSL